MLYLFGETEAGYAGRNLPRDNRTKEVSLDTSLEDFNSSRLFLFRQDTTPPYFHKTLFCYALKKSRGLGQSPSAPPEKFVFRSIRRVVNFGGPGVPML